MPAKLSAKKLSTGFRKAVAGLPRALLKPLKVVSHRQLTQKEMRWARNRVEIIDAETSVQSGLYLTAQVPRQVRLTDYRRYETTPDGQYLLTVGRRVHYFTEHEGQTEWFKEQGMLIETKRYYDSEGKLVKVEFSNKDNRPGGPFNKEHNAAWDYDPPGKFKGKRKK